MALLLVDGTYELFRAHYSRRPSRADADGRDVKATVGVVSFLLGLLTEAGPEVHVAVAFDNPIESFRNDRFPPYKDSSGVEPGLLAQFDLVEEAVAALGVTVWSMDTFEADDALATAALLFAGSVDQVRVLTPDKDLGQIVRDPDIVQVDVHRERVFDEAGVVERLGIRPPSVPDYLALVGDSADGLPGLRGFGAKTAAAVLSRYPHLEDIPPDHTDWDVSVRGGARLSETLRADFDDALLYRDLATLRTDVALGVDLDALLWRGVPRGRYLDLCDRLAVETLRERPRRWRDGG